MSRRKLIGGSSFVALGLGALGGCSDPADGVPFVPADLFRGADFQGTPSSEAWKKYLKAEKLHKAWAPDPVSPWRPYYRPTLPAAIEIVSSAARPIRRNVTQPVAAAEGFIAKTSLDRSAIFIDLPGDDSVVWGIQLAKVGCLPVLTFNNWPHPHGSVALERPLGALLHYAEEMDQLRRTVPVASSTRPAFVLEGNRLVAGHGGFDNRYFHVDSDFPGAAILKGSRVDTVYYVSPKGKSNPCEDDLVNYFVALAAAGMKFNQVIVDKGTVEIKPWVPPLRATIFSPITTAPYAFRSGTYGRSYHHYHAYWVGTQSTWGSGSSGGGSSGYS